MTFEKLHLIEPLLRAVASDGYTTPTPIQQKAIPYLLEGRDLVGCAQTGTGKTAAFALPILQRLAGEPRPASPGARPIRVLVLTPTRELASQIGDSFATYGRHLPFKHAVIFGGVGQDAQTRALRAGIDILVATPGRLLDLMGQKLVRFEQLEVFVLDEADRMLDMGFIHDVRRVIGALPRKRQTLLFSATMPEEIRELSATILHDPVRVEVAPVAATADRIEQSIYFVDKASKRDLLEHLLRDGSITRALVFTRTKHGANKVAQQLDRAGIVADAIHGNKSQNARERALEAFKRGAARVLVATDIAARGLDVDGISHVINYDLPNIPESYVHRIGRTARAGASGIAISFCDSEEREFLVDIERLIRVKVPVVSDHPFVGRRAPALAEAPEGRQGGRGAAGPREGQRSSQGGRPPGGRPQGGRSQGGRSQSPARDPRARREGSSQQGSGARQGAGGGGGKRRPSVADVMAFWKR